MKELLVGETIAVAMGIAIVILGSVMGWPNEIIAAVTCASAAFVAVAAAPFTAATALAVVAATYAVAAIFAAFVAAPTVSFLLLVIALTGALSIVAAVGLEIEYHWVLLNFLGEGAIICAILYYGPGIVRMAM